MWDEAVRRRVRAAFAATVLGYAEATAERTISWIDEATNHWRAERTTTCEQFAVHGAWDADKYDRAS